MDIGGAPDLQHKEADEEGNAEGHAEGGAQGFGDVGLGHGGLRVDTQVNTRHWVSQGQIYPNL